MITINQISVNQVNFNINTEIFNDAVITKTLYWLQSDYFIFWDIIDSNIQKIIIEKKNGNLTDSDILTLKNRVGQNLIDFKTRQLIIDETKNIRDILYVKAFANNDDFEDYNLLTNKDV